MSGIRKSIVLITLLSMLGLFNLGATASTASSTPVNLVYWRVAEETPSDFEGILRDFSTAHPNIRVTLKTVPYATFRDKLVSALATEDQVDIFSFRNDQTLSYLPYLYPMPRTINTVVTEQSGTGGCSKQKNTTTTLYSPTSVRKTFVDVVADDVIWKDAAGQENIIGLPIYVDTLALFYNKTLLNAAGIEQPPTTWTEFQEDVNVLTKVSPSGTLTRPGASLGASTNINRASDILSMLMMQNGAVMNGSDGKSVSFDDIINVTDENGEQSAYYPGEKALEYYTSYATPGTSVYSWNEQQNHSIDMFSAGELPMMFHYAYMIPVITERAPSLRFDVALAPQIEGNDIPINYAHYFIEGVSGGTKYPDQSFELLKYLTDRESNQAILETIKRSPARRDLLEDPDLSELTSGNVSLEPFFAQTLTAQSWNKLDGDKYEQIFADMITSVITGKQTVRKAIDDAASSMNILSANQNPQLSEKFKTTESTDSTNGL